MNEVADDNKETEKPKKTDGAKKAKRKMTGKSSKRKGSAWERNVGKMLSLWLTKGERPDLFSRNVLSGGSFTRAAAAGKHGGMPGDIIAAHPLALAFVQTFAVECKHQRDVNLERYVLSAGKTDSFLGRTVDLIRSQTDGNDLNWLVIAKQNNRPAFVLMGAMIGMDAARSVDEDTYLTIHTLFNGSVTMMPFTDLLKTKPDEFLTFVKGVPVPEQAPPPAPRRPLIPPSPPTRRRLTPTPEATT
jgi:hypothetical protein